MAQFKIPSGPDISILNIENLKGVDLYNSPSNVENYRSPDAPNMIRDVPGKVRKRMGYHLTETYDGRINGVHKLVDDSGEHIIIHAGTKLYLNGEAIYEEMNDVRSKAYQLKKKLYILDGKKFLAYGEFEEEGVKAYAVKPVSEKAYVPKIIISRDPEGGGTALEPINLLGSKWTESFYGKSSVTKYQLSYGNLDETKVTAKKMTSSGVWKDLVEATDFTVDREKGLVTFTSAPGATPVSGQDNVEITASRLWGECEYKTEEFTGTGSQKDFVLTTAVGDEKLTATVGDKKYTEGDGFTVKRTTKTVTFTTAPAKDATVKITYKAFSYAYADKINHCDIAVLYGVNGASDRLFVTGNPKYPNYDWYSEMNDPTYFGDLWYSVIGQDSSRILGYSIVNDRLAAHKDEGDDGRNIVLRYGFLQNEKAAFPIVGALQGAGALGKYTFAYLSSEPVFLTRLGVYAITPADITGERYAQNRSFYINKALQEEANPEEAYGFSYKDFYLLSLNGTVYLLDGLQKTYEKNQPYSVYQYECYYWTGINARILWEQDGALCFGTGDGKIMKFYTDPEAQESYNDNGQAIISHWDLPDIDGKYFYKNKTFRYIAVRLASAIATGVRIKVQKKGIWYDLWDSGGKARYFDFGYIDFGKLSFSSDRTPRTLGRKIKIKKVDKARFRLENNELNEPFGIYNIALEFVEDKNYKG